MFLFSLEVLEICLLLLEREHLIYLRSKQQDQFVISNVSSMILSLLVSGAQGPLVSHCFLAVYILLGCSRCKSLSIKT